MPLPWFWHRLAVVSVMLMICAPLLSRWLQSLPAEPAPVMQAMADAGHTMAMHSMPAAHAQHARHHDTHAPSQPPAGAHDHHGAQHANAPPSTGSDSTNPHAAHGEACEYCVLSARVLPALFIVWLAVVIEPPAPQTAMPASAPLSEHRIRAHSPRGPPLAA